MTFVGFFSTRDGSEEFLYEYGKITSSVNKAETTLVLDIKELKPFEQEFVDSVEVVR